MADNYFGNGYWTTSYFPAGYFGEEGSGNTLIASIGGTSSLGGVLRAEGQLLDVIAASATVTSNIGAVGHIADSMSGQGDITVDITALANIVSVVTASSSIAADLNAVANISASVTASSGLYGFAEGVFNTSFSTVSGTSVLIGNIGATAFISAGIGGSGTLIPINRRKVRGGRGGITGGTSTNIGRRKNWPTYMPTQEKDKETIVKLPETETIVEKPIVEIKPSIFKTKLNDALNNYPRATGISAKLAGISKVVCDAKTINEDDRVAAAEQVQKILVALAPRLDMKFDVKQVLQDALDKNQKKKTLDVKKLLTDALKISQPGGKLNVQKLLKEALNGPELKINVRKLLTDALKA